MAKKKWYPVAHWIEGGKRHKTSPPVRLHKGYDTRKEAIADFKKRIKAKKIKIPKTYKKLRITGIKKWR